MRTISDTCESCPDLFMRRTYLPLMHKVREALAALVNAHVDDCVLVGRLSPALEDGLGLIGGGGGGECVGGG